MATPKKRELTPRAVIKWLEGLRKLSVRRADAATRYQIQYMFKYIERLVQYQETMPPEIDEEDTSRFRCRRCGESMQAESGTADEYAFCPLCGQRWRNEEENES